VSVPNENTPLINGKPYRLRLPGPTAVPLRVREASAQTILNHRGPEFASQLGEVVEMLRPVIGTSNDILVFASSGTGVMEASLANIIAPGDKILVLSNGQWGERFTSIANALFQDITIDKIEVPWGAAVLGNDLKERLSSDGYAAVIAVHNESSTGAISDLAEIGALVRDTSAVLIVDSVSGTGGMEMRQDEWGIDVLITASQKALMCPPGIGIVSVSDKAWERIENDAQRARFYWDFRKAREWAPKGQTAFTPPVSLIAGLHEALVSIHEESLQAVLKRHERLAKALQAGGFTMGFTLFPTAPMTSNTVTVFAVPDGVDGVDIVKRMYQDHGSVIAGSRNALRGKIIRIGTMGAITEDDIMTDLEHLEATMISLGVDLTPGTAVAAARATL